MLPDCTLRGSAHFVILHVALLHTLRDYVLPGYMFRDPTYVAWLCSAYIYASFTAWSITM